MLLPAYYMRNIMNIVSFLLLTIFSYSNNFVVTAVPSDFLYPEALFNSQPQPQPQPQPQQLQLQLHSQQEQQYVLEDVECIVYKEEIQVTQDIDEEEYVCGLLFDYDDYLGKKNRRDATTDLMGGMNSNDISLSLVPIEYESVDIRNNLDSKRIRSGEYKMKLSRVIATTTTTMSTTSSDGGFGGRLRRGNIQNNNSNIITSLFIPSDAQIIIEEYQDEAATTTSGSTRHLAKSKGTLQTLVVRVIDVDGIGPSPTKDQLCDETFRNTTSSLSAQYKACSYNQLNIEPATSALSDNTTPGIIEIQINSVRMADGDVKRKTIQVAAMIELKNYVQQQTTSTSLDEYDLIMFCFPPGSIDNWLAYAVLNSKFSYYNDVWCRSLSAKMHEIGHNLNLGHSGENGSQQDDETDYMGYSYLEYDTPRMCFNPAKSYQFGWYTNQQKTINPLVDIYTTPSTAAATSSSASASASASASKTFTMVGVSDYDPDGNDSKLVVLHLEQPGLVVTDEDTNESESIIQDYFIGYNRKSNMNIGVKENPNTISIIEKESGLPNQYGRSTKKASLMLGQSYTIKDYSNQIGKDIHIEFIGLSQPDGSEAIIKITDVYNCENDDECNPSNFNGEDNKNNVMTGNNSSPCVEYRIAIKFDQYPGDITWLISTMDTDDNNKGIISAVAEGSGYENENPFTMVERTVCLLYDKTYTYTITDYYGDGLCCKNGQGYYEIYDPNGIKVIEDNGQFTNTKTNTFTVPPSLAPEQLPEIITEEDTIKEESNKEVDACVDNVNFRYKSINKKDCSWVKKRNSRKKWCNKDAIPSSSNSIDVNDDSNKKKIRDHCPTVCVKECISTTIIKTCKDKKQKIKFEGKRNKCKWFSANDKCDIKKGKKYIYERCPMSCGKCSPPL